MVEENDNIELPPGDDDEEEIITEEEDEDSPLRDDTFHQGEQQKLDSYGREIEESQGEKRSFVVNLFKLKENLDLVSQLLTKYDKDFKESGKSATGLDFLRLASEVKQFQSGFDRSLRRGVASVKRNRDEEKDFFGNEFKTSNGKPSYNRAQIIHSNDYIIFSVRMYDTGDREIESFLQSSNAYVLTGEDMLSFNGGIVNDPTIMNLIANLDEIAEQITFSGLLPQSGPLSLQCGGRNAFSDIASGPGLSNAEKLGDAAADFVTSAATIEDLTWEGFTKKYIYPTVDIEPAKSKKMTSGDAAAFLKSLEKKLKNVRTEAERARDRDKYGAGFKLAISSAREKGFEFANSSHKLLSSAAKDELKSSLNSFRDGFTEVLDRVSLGCLLKSAAECLLPALSCRDILRGIRFSNLPSRLNAAFPNQPRLVGKINKELCKIEDPDGNIDLVLDTIEKFVDLEVLCDVANWALGGGSGFSLPEFSLPQWDIMDLFGSLRISIDQAILEFLNEAIIQMILGILEDLASCDNLDALVSGVIDGEIGTDAGVAGDVANLFIKGEDFQPGESAVANSLGNRWTQFETSAEPMFARLIKLEQSSEFNALGGALEAKQDFTARPLQTVFPRKTQKDKTASELLDDAVDQSAQVSLDTRKLIKFNGEGKEVYESAVDQFGKYTLSSDGKRFVFKRQTDDTLIVESVPATPAGVASTVPVPGGQAPGARPGCPDTPEPEIELALPSKKEMQLAQAVAMKEGVYDQLAQRSGTKNARAGIKEFSKLLDDVTVLFAPREVLRLLSGEADEALCKEVQNFANIKHPGLKFMKSPMKICQMFDTLGKITGLDKLQDDILLASAGATIKEVKIPCAPGDDPAENLREKILEDGGLPPEEIKKKLDDIRDKKRDRYNEIADTIANLQDPTISLEEALAPLVCGLDPSTGKLPPLVDNMLDLTIDTYLQPVQISFNEEVDVYTEAITEQSIQTIEVPPLLPDGDAESDDRTKQERIEEKLNISSFGDIGKLLLNLGGGGADEIFGDEERGEMMNPRWAKMINDGFIPKNGDSNDDLGPYTKAQKNNWQPTSITDIGIPETPWPMVKEPISRVGESLKKGLVKYVDDFSIDGEAVILEGNMGGSTTFSSLLGSGDIGLGIGLAPSGEGESAITPEVNLNTFVMSYTPKNSDGETELGIVTNGASKMFHPISGKDSSTIFLLKKKYKGDIQVQNTLDNEFNGSDSRVGVFAGLIINRLKGGFANQGDPGEEYNDFFQKKYNDLYTGSIEVSAVKVSENRLLEEPDSINPTTNMPSPNPESGSMQVNAIVSIVDFAASASPAQKACGQNPNLMALDDLKFMMKEEFSRSSCEERRPVGDGNTEQRGPVVSAAILGAVMGTIRLFMVEQVLRAVFVYDEFRYSENLFVEDELLMDFTIERMKISIKSQEKNDNYYRIFLKESILTYNRRIKKGDINLKGELIPFESKTNENKEETKKQVSGETPEMKEERYLSSLSLTDLENLATVALKELSKEQMRSVLKKFSFILGGRQPVNFKRELLKETPIVEIKDEETPDRFAGIFAEGIPEGGKFILEKYIRSAKDPSTVESVGIVEVNDKINSLAGWERFTQQQSEENSEMNIKENFNGLWKYGMRLTYIPYLDPDNVPDFSSKMDRDKADTFKSYYEELQGGNTITPIPITTVEIPIQEFEKIEDSVGRISSLYNSKYEDILLNLMVENRDFKLIFDHCLSSKESAALLTIYTTMVLNSMEMDRLFVETKGRLKSLLIDVLESTNALEKPDSIFSTDASTELQNAQRSAGQESPGMGLKVLKIILNTPIWIMKGVAEMMDPNVFITSKIQAAGKAGYLIPRLQLKPGWNRAPKLDGDGNPIEGECEDFVQTAPTTPGKYRKNEETGEFEIQIEDFEGKLLGVIEPKPSDLRTGGILPAEADLTKDLFKTDILKLFEESADEMVKLLIATFLVTVDPLGPVMGHLAPLPLAFTLINPPEGLPLSENLGLAMQQLESGYLGPGLPFAVTNKIVTVDTAKKLLSSLDPGIPGTGALREGISEIEDVGREAIILGLTERPISIKELLGEMANLLGSFGLPGGAAINSLASLLPNFGPLAKEVELNRDMVEYLLDLLDPSPSAPVFPGHKVDIPLNFLTWSIPNLRPYNLYLGPGAPLLYIGAIFLLAEPALYNLPKAKEEAKYKIMPPEIDFNPSAASKVECPPEEDADGNLSPGTTKNC